VDEPKFDLAFNAELQNGLVLLSHRRYARGILVQPFRAATVCEFEPALETGRVVQFGSDHGYRTNEEGIAIGLDPNAPGKNASGTNTPRPHVFCSCCRAAFQSRAKAATRL
jgi:hypothetical protein